MANSPRFDVIWWVRNNMWWLKSAAILAFTVGSAILVFVSTQRSQGETLAALVLTMPRVQKQVTDQKEEFGKKLQDQDREQTKKLLETRAEVLGLIAVMNKNFNDWRDESTRRDQLLFRQLSAISQDLGIALGRTENRGYLAPRRPEEHGNGGR